MAVLVASVLSDSELLDAATGISSGRRVWLNDRRNTRLDYRSRDHRALPSGGVLALRFTWTGNSFQIPDGP